MMSLRTSEMTKPTEGRRGSMITSLLKGNSNLFLINLVCPDNTIVTKTHTVNKTVQDIIMDSCKQLEIDRPEIFAIALYEHNEFRFISRKKTLHKFLPNAAMISQEQAINFKTMNVETLLNNSIKSCRLYLRVRHFYVSTNEIGGNTLYYFYQQVRLDALKHQNWLNIEGYTEIFYNLAAKSIWLKYETQAKKIIESNKKPLHYFLPQSERNENSKLKVLELLDCVVADVETSANTLPNNCYDTELEVKTNGLDEKENSGKRNSADPIINIQSNLDVPNIKIERAFTIAEQKATIMRDIIAEATKLPFYGMYYYHVTLIQPDDTKSVYCCKLGIGPFGVCVNLSTDYTTWLEHASWDWNSIEEIDFHKNILHIHEINIGFQQYQAHRFECLDEKEAKYLFKQLRESHLFQIKTLEKIRRRSEHNKKRNSIGIVSSDIASTALSPLLAQSSRDLLRPRSNSDYSDATSRRSNLNIISHKNLQRTKSS